MPYHSVFHMSRAQRTPDTDQIAYSFILVAWCQRYQLLFVAHPRRPFPLAAGVLKREEYVASTPCDVSPKLHKQTQITRVPPKVVARASRFTPPVHFVFVAGHTRKHHPPPLHQYLSMPPIYDFLLCFFCHQEKEKYSPPPTDSEEKKNLSKPTTGKKPLFSPVVAPREVQPANRGRESERSLRCESVYPDVCHKIIQPKTNIVFFFFFFAEPLAFLQNIECFFLVLSLLFDAFSLSATQTVLYQEKGEYSQC